MGSRSTPINCAECGGQTMGHKYCIVCVKERKKLYGALPFRSWEAKRRYDNHRTAFEWDFPNEFL